MKKKMLSLLMAGVMVLSLFGCGSKGEEAGKSATQSEPAADTGTPADNADTAGEKDTEDKGIDGKTEGKDTLSAEGMGGYKIGFFYLPASDKTSQAFRDALDYCAKLTNCEMEYYDMTAFSSEDISTAFETLVSNGCDGIVSVLGSSPALYEYLNENEVYYVGLTRSYTEELAKVVDASDFCAGWVGDLGGEEGVNFQNGYDLAQVLVKDGCKKIAVIGGSEGETMNDERVAGVEAAAAEAGMEVLATYRGSDAATGFSDILAAYGNDLDGIACTGGGDQGVAAIQSAGLSGKVKLVQIDAASETREYMEAGLLAGTLAGGTTYMMGAYMQLFNAMSGADRLFNEGSKIVPQFNGFVVSSVDEWDLAEYCTMGEVPGGILPDELLSLNSLCNPGMSVEEREQLLKDYQNPEYWNVTAINERVSAYLK